MLTFAALGAFVLSELLPPPVAPKLPAYSMLTAGIIFWPIVFLLLLESSLFPIYFNPEAAKVFALAVLGVFIAMRAGKNGKLRVIAEVLLTASWCLIGTYLCYGLLLYGF